MNFLGKHSIAEYYDCDRDIINDQNLIEKIMLEAVEISGATLVKTVFHKFSPHGVTGVVVVAESHFSIHTWPEYGYCAVDIFTCGDVINNPLALSHLKKRLFRIVYTAISFAHLEIAMDRMTNYLISKEAKTDYKI